MSILIACFSKSGSPEPDGSTGKLARIISGKTGGSLFTVRPSAPYPEDAEELNKKARSERESNARPEIMDYPQMDGVDSIVLVYPNWWGDLPMAMYTLLDNLTLDGISVYPVCTHEDNGLGYMERMLKEAYPTADIRKGLAIKGSIVHSDEEGAEKRISKYLQDSGLI